MVVSFDYNQSDYRVVSNPLPTQKNYTFLLKVPIYPLKSQTFPFFTGIPPLDQPSQFSPSEPWIRYGATLFFCQNFIRPFLPLPPNQ